MLGVYGIRNCDTCRKAWKWLDAQGIGYQWIDLRAEGVDRSVLAGWVARVGLEGLANRRSATWRALSDAQRAGLSADDGIGLLLDNPTLIKRPVFDHRGEIRVGFTPEVRAWLAGDA